MRTLALLVAALALAGARDLGAQRCGDELWLYFTDAGGKAIPPHAFDSVMVSASYTVPNVAPLVDARPGTREIPPRLASFSIRVECGIVVAEVRARRQGRLMTIRVRNVPGDAGNILIDGISFAEGTREVDLGGRPLRNVEEARPRDGPEGPRWIVRSRSLRKAD